MGAGGFERRVTIGFRLQAFGSRLSALGFQADTVEPP
jgi:hypothetical protein